jgi:HSP20 family protein
MTYAFPIAPTFPGSTLRRELDRLFEDRVPARTAERVWQPSVTAREDEKGFTLDVDIPGIDPDGIEVLAEDGVLTVKGSRAERATAEGEKVLFAEQPRGQFQRSFRLPKQADPETVAASYAFGVLTVRVEKPTPARPRRVPVNVQAQTISAT